ncbi:zinc ABC transporter substrate-binding protein [Thiomonas sp.]|uniref:zinc ABC transporter substrate-binding protein n=1 Tax=Thiomonas sp. TaxID=2047785 RepID=UPI00261B481C|nr:zinc ABC transporter substrate-binding protein [Thiomonas sp.]
MLPVTRRHLLRRLALTAVLAPLAAQAQTPQRVAVSIKPVGDLVAAVMAAVGSPTVLIPPGSSPHTYAFKPSERAAAEQAQVLFWIGPQVEPALQRIVQTLPQTTRVVTLSTLPGITLLAPRTGGDWERRHPAPRAVASGAAALQGAFDGHIWLSPDNAKTILRAAAQTLAAVDPAHAQQYQSNAQRAVQRLDALNAELVAELAPVRDKPFIVFHDAYQYFEHAYGLHAVGSILVTPEAMANARRVSQMRDKIRSLGAVCVFSEPQFEPRLVHTLVEGTSARLGTLDPLGAKGPLGLAGYEQLLRGLARNLSQCLGAKTAS